MILQRQQPLIQNQSKEVGSLQGNDLVSRQQLNTQLERGNHRSVLRANFLVLRI